MAPVKIYISLASDRDAMVTVLAWNGYTVRQGREKAGKSYRHFVEYWRDGE